MAKKNYTVYKTEKGWAEKNNDKLQPAMYHNTQKEAIESARRRIKNSPQGGELSVKGLDGKFRAKDTVGPGNDPYPPQG